MNIVGPWKTAWFCTSCKEQLTTHELYNSHGRCPHCGFKGKNACSIAENFERAYRDVVIYHPPWWKFWVKPITKIEYLDEEKIS